jgi:hypothetical protein
LEHLKEARRFCGKDKEKRDLLVYLLLQRCAFTNVEIGVFFGVTYTAISHILKKAKSQLKADLSYEQKYEWLNSQIKM